MSYHLTLLKMQVRESSVRVGGSEGKVKGYLKASRVRVTEKGKEKHD